METVTLNVGIIKWVVLGIIIIVWWLKAKKEQEQNGGGGYLRGIEQIMPFMGLLVAIIVWLILFFAIL